MTNLKEIPQQELTRITDQLNSILQEKRDQFRETIQETAKETLLVEGIDPDLYLQFLSEFFTTI